jgi:nucleotide-binding universal stress UspA family protein
MQRASADAQILICHDGSNDAEGPIAAAVALFGPRRAVALTVAPATRLREVSRGSVSHDVATHARRPVLILPPPTQGAG